MTTRVASLAVATNISPHDLMRCDDEMLEAIEWVLREQERQAKKANRRR